MEAYTAFAKVYDRFMENVPYEKWGAFLDFVISEYGISKPLRDSEDALESERNLVLDLGCGTGVLTEIMYNKGYDMIGIDISQEMLDVALKRKLEPLVQADGDDSENISDNGILYLCQDMCEIDLYSTIGTVYSSCDSVNYLVSDEEITACFAGVDNYLYPGGLFIFDFNTVYKYRDVIGECTIAENSEDCSFIWDNYYYSDENINEYDLTLFVKEDNDLYRRYEETHYQRGYTAGQMRDFLERAGLKLLAMLDEKMLDGDYAEDLKKIMNFAGAYSADGRICVNNESERIIVIAQKAVD